MVDLLNLLIKRARKGLYGQSKTARLDPIMHSPNNKQALINVHVPLKNKESSIARQVLGESPKKVIITFAKKIHKKKWIFTDILWQ